MKFNFQLYRETWHELTQGDDSIPLQVFETIASTNIKLWELIDRDRVTPQAAIALQQTAGRGQWGRVWQSSLGGLYLSVGISPQISLADNAHLVMSTAWGIAKILRNYGVPISLKWPNDLILEGRKLGGIKIETRTRQQQITQAVIGVGINWINDVPPMAINLKSYSQQVPSLEALSAIAIYGILSGYEYYRQAGIKNLVENYLEILLTLGETIIYNGSPGRVIGVSDRGELRVKLISEVATSTINLSPGQISLGYNITSW
jgi:BirA family transcriptional regulator, biotin operon repressor / biotin---[acetyl-CoA-carboxylase] ligase